MLKNLLNVMQLKPKIMQLLGYTSNSTTNRCTVSQDEVALTPPTVPKKRPRGRPPKLKKDTESPKKHRGRLTNEQRSSLVSLYNEGVPLEVLSKSFNISKGYASVVGRSGRTESKKKGRC